MLPTTPLPTLRSLLLLFLFCLDYPELTNLEKQLSSEREIDKVMRERSTATTAVVTARRERSTERDEGKGVGSSFSGFRVQKRIGGGFLFHMRGELIETSRTFKGALRINSPYMSGYFVLIYEACPAYVAWIRPLSS
ncbi:hypothetical protein Q3G72_003343 [Acer saccharum]|nr:hypothetical protein Q3G72_003343 [Acer saccharum]